MLKGINLMPNDMLHFSALSITFFDSMDTFMFAKMMIADSGGYLG